MRERHGKYDYFLDGDSLGPRFKFYILGITLKNFSITNKPFDITLFLLYVISVYYTSTYPILEEFDLKRSEFDLVKLFIDFLLVSYDFELSPVLVYIVRLLFLFIIIFTIVSFMACLYKLRFVYYFHHFLNLRYHLPLLSFVSSISLSAILNGFKQKNIFDLLLLVLFAVSFPLYVIILSVFAFFESTTVIKPKFFYSTFFSPIMIYIVIFTVINGLVNLNYRRQSMTTGTILICIPLVFALFIIYNLVMYIPFMLPVANEIYLTIFSVIFMLGITNIVAMFGYVYYVPVFFEFLPITAILIYVLVHRLILYYDLKYIKLMEQFEDIDPYSLSETAIDRLLYKIKKERHIKSYYRNCLSVWNERALSEPILAYFLKKYPESEWLSSMTVFLYLVYWKTNEDTYKFFLHCLCNDTHSYITEFIMFQYVYYFQCLGVPTSPIIRRSLSSYRKNVLQFAHCSRLFWQSCFLQNEELFSESYFDLCVTFDKMRAKIKQMLAFFPFSPVVLAEASILESEYFKNYARAHYFYKKSNKLLEHIWTIKDAILEDYAGFFPLVSKSEEEDTMNYRMLLINEDLPNVSKLGVTLELNDYYLNSLTSTYSIQKNTPQLNLNFDRMRSIFFYVILIAYVISFALLSFINFYVAMDIDKRFSTYQNLVYAYQNTSLLRSSLSALNFGLFSYYNYHDNYSQSFWNYYFNCLGYPKENINYYQNLIPTILKDSDDVESFLLDYNTTISAHIAYVENTYTFFNSSNFDLVVNESASIIDNFNSTVSLLDNGSIKYNETLYNLLNQNIRSGFYHVKFYSILLLSVGIFCTIFFPIFISKLLDNLRTNIFSILKTCQPPLSKKLSCLFEKVLIFDNRQVTVKKVRYKYVGLAVVFSFLPLLLSPMISLVVTVKHYGNVSSVIQSPVTQSLPVVTDDSLLVLLNYASVVYNNIGDHSTGYDIDQCLFLRVAGTPVEEISNDSFLYILTKTSSFLYICLSTLVGLSFMVYALSRMTSLFNLIHTGKILVKFIPIECAMSSPIINKLLNKEKVTTSEVTNFNKEIAFVPDNYSFFCIVEFNKRLDIINKCGNCYNIIGFDPGTLDELLKNLASKSHREFTYPLLKSVVNEKGFISIPFYNGQEIFMDILCDGVLIMKDDTHNKLVNQQHRKLSVINSMIQTLLNRKHSSISDFILFAVYSSSTELASIILASAIEFDNIQLLEGRFHCLIFATDSNEDGLNTVKLFHERIKRYRDRIRVAFHVGDSLLHNPVNKSYTKPRWVGSSIDIIENLVRASQDGEVSYTKDFALIFCPPETKPSTFTINGKKYEIYLGA